MASEYERKPEPSYEYRDRPCIKCGKVRKMKGYCTESGWWRAIHRYCQACRDHLSKMTGGLGDETYPASHTNNDELVKAFKNAPDVPCYRGPRTHVYGSRLSAIPPRRKEG
jgi:hypothetical protein